MNELRRSTIAEAYGTFLLTLIGPGSIVTMYYLQPFSSRGPSAAAMGFIGLAHGVALMVAAYSIGHISGAHINPAVTIAQWATHRIEKNRVAPYIAAQATGAILAGFATIAIWSSSSSTYSAAQDTFLGSTMPSSSFGTGAALLVEVIATALLVFTIFGVTDKAADKSWAGGAIGFALAAVIWVFGPISGASLNPARSFGPALVSSVFDLAAFSALWIYIVGPVLGALLGGFLYETVK